MFVSLAPVLTFTIMPVEPDLYCWTCIIGKRYVSPVMTKSTTIRHGPSPRAILRNPVNGRILGSEKRSEFVSRSDFWSRVNKNAPNGCWEWTAGKSSSVKGRDYGLADHCGKRWKAHRLAWIFEFGPIPDDTMVLHKCDNPPCCNPAHLFLGNNTDNQRDCIQKGRGNREHGTDRYNAVLKEEDILEIRRIYRPRHPEFSGRKLAARFGVATTMISAIIGGKRWKHV